MSRAPHRLQALVQADQLVVDVHRATQDVPAAERFGLQSQIGRGAVSVAANLVEGCARRSQRDGIHFVGIAIASASAVRYLLALAVRLGFADASHGDRLKVSHGHVIRALQAARDHSRLIAAPGPEVRGPKPSTEPHWT